MNKKEIKFHEKEPGTKEEAGAHAHAQAQNPTFSPRRSNLIQGFLATHHSANVCSLSLSPITYSKRSLLSSFLSLSSPLPSKHESFARNRTQQTSVSTNSSALFCKMCFPMKRNSKEGKICLVEPR